jgi:hypothetical protein
VEAVSEPEPDVIPSKIPDLSGVPWGEPGSGEDWAPFSSAI